MDTTTMVLGGFQQMAQHDASRRIVPTEYIVNYSTYAQYMHNYPLSFNYGSFGCSSSPATVDGFTTLCSIGAQQSLCVPPPYTDPRCIAQVQSVGSKSTQSSNSPFVKAEDASPEEAGEGFHDISPQKLHSPGTSTEPSYGTDVDTLMRAIQTKSGNSRPQSRSSTSSQLGSTPYAHGPEPRNRARETGFEHTGFRTRKKYQCYVPSCAKIFFQKTHLEIHVRAHTGHKPFLCKEASCGQRFSQLGNLKETHERRHTGERPYSCESCGKRFAQRGNVRAHRIVHQQIKPFTCKLEACGKQFTQLGNLKSHQNKFHSATLRNLTLRFATMREGDAVSAADKDLWEYFATLYKHSNKGIKGRGKDRRIFSVSRDDEDIKHEARSTSSGVSVSSNGDGKDDISGSSISSSSTLEFNKPTHRSTMGGWAG